MVERRVPRWLEFSELVRPRRLPGDALDRRLARAATIGDLRELARRTVPRAVFDYADGAAGAEISLRRSREAFERIEFCPRVLRDVSDGQTAHLHGLNLSRAWCLRRLARALPASAEEMLAAAGEHAAVALPHVSGSDYMVEHWLAAYALLYLDEQY